MTPDRIATVAGARSPGGIDVWFFGTATALFDEDVLDASEVARGAQFLTEALRRRFRSAHATLRAILAAYLQCAPRDVAIVTGPHGKPQLRDGPFRFNLTHKDEVAALAIAGGDVGIDCERIDAGMDYGALLPTVAHPAECIDSRELFFRTWARKEAVMKQRGLGFLLAPARIEAFASGALDPAWRRARIDGSDGPFVRDIDAPDGYVAALAADVGDVRITTLAGPAPAGG